ncbi:MAG: hypothetical protein OXU41_00280 [Gammaproteobacteria bacterium]|nr:hypothetical protein [Gammaproteobacteria bacterium]
MITPERRKELLKGAKSEPETLEELICKACAYAVAARVTIADIERGKFPIPGKSRNISPAGHAARTKFIRGEYKMRPMLEEELEKMGIGNACHYCMSTENIQNEHLIPRSRGPQSREDDPAVYRMMEDSKNLVFACRDCNGAREKGAKDLMKWMTEKNRFPPVFILTRYLKWIEEYCEVKGIMEKTLQEIKEEGIRLPFDIDCIPYRSKHYPADPGELRLRVVVADGAQN